MRGLRRRHGRAGTRQAWVITIRGTDYNGEDYSYLGDVYRDKDSAREFARRLSRSHPGVQYGVRPITVPARQVRNWHPSENRRSRREGP